MQGKGIILYKLSYYLPVLVFTIGLLFGVLRCNNNEEPHRESSDDLLVQKTGLYFTDIGSTASGVLPGQAQYQYSIPKHWNGDLVIYAHGYISPQNPLTIPDDAIDGWLISDLILRLRYAYATTSYRTNGVIIESAIDDILELVQEFSSQNSRPARIYLIGECNGGLIATLALERYPDVFHGGISIGGPIGSYRQQVNHFGDFHVLFRYLYKGELEKLNLDIGSPAAVPNATLDNWWRFQTNVKEMIRENPEKLKRLLDLMRLPTNDGIDELLNETTFQLLTYNVLGTNQLNSKFGGVPYDNSTRKYRGNGSILSNWKLNRSIERFRISPSSARVIDRTCKPTGRLTRPLITIHNLDDPIVQYYHEILYRLRVYDQGSSAYHVNIPIDRYGHCNIRESEFLAGFSILIAQAASQSLVIPAPVISNKEQRKHLYQLTRNYGVTPLIAEAE